MQFCEIAEIDNISKLFDFFWKVSRIFENQDTENKTLESSYNYEKFRTCNFLKTTNHFGLVIGSQRAKHAANNY